MKDTEKDIQNMLDVEAVDDFEDVIVFTDDDGKEHLFYEEQQFEVGNKTFAVLVGLSEDTCACGDGDCHCHEHEHEHQDEDTAILAKIEFDKDGVPVYVEPTEEEFKAAQKAYAELED